MDSSKKHGALCRAALAKFAQDTPPDAYFRGLSAIKTPLIKLARRYEPSTLVRHLAGAPYNLTITAAELQSCLKKWSEAKPKSRKPKKVTETEDSKQDKSAPVS